MMFDGLHKPSISFDGVSKIIKEKTRSGQDVVERFLDDDVQATLRTEENRYLMKENRYTELEPQSSVANTLSHTDAVHLYGGAFTSHVRETFLQDYLDTPCPICGHYFDDRTLDHVLPKAKYTLTPINLVPMCWNCNKAKGESKVSFHPYFQDLSRLEGISFKFDFSQLRVVSMVCSQDKLAQYMNVYGMGKKLEVEANNQLRTLKTKILKLATKMPSKQKVINIITRQREVIDIDPWKRIFYNDLLVSAIDFFYNDLCKRYKYAGTLCKDTVLDN